MKLTKKNIKTITDRYSLSEVVKITPIEEGWVNYSFNFETTKGDFIVQVIGSNYSKGKEKNMKIQFALLDTLRKKGFPYEVPSPLKNKAGKHILKIGPLYLWVYRRIEGEPVKNINQEQFKQAAKALAIYHKLIKSFSPRCDKKSFFDFDRLSAIYETLKIKKPRDKTDSLMLTNLGYFKELWNKLRRIDFREQLIITHSDFNSSNFIFRKGKLIGIIDFDNLQFAPLAKDISLAVERCDYLGEGYSEKKKRIFVKEYEKYNKLSSRSKNLIIPILLKDNCRLIWWFYEGMKKNLDKRHSSVVETIRNTKKFAKSL